MSDDSIRKFRKLSRLWIFLKFPANLITINLIKGWTKTTEVRKEKRKQKNEFESKFDQKKIFWIRVAWMVIQVHSKSSDEWNDV